MTRRKKSPSPLRNWYNPVSSVEEIAHRSASVFNKYNIKKAAVFGSFARGEQTAASDVDIVLDFQGSALKLVHIKEELEESFQRPVDIITFNYLFTANDPSFTEPVKRDLKYLRK